MAQRVYKSTLHSVASEVESSEEKVDEGLAGAGRRLRMRKVPETVVSEEQREDKQLKELGLFEEGMSREQKQELLLVVAASKKSATIEKKHRQISDDLDCKSELDPEYFSSDQSAADPNAKPQNDVKEAKSPTTSPFFNASGHSSPLVVPESPDMLDTIFLPPERQSETENDQTLKKTESVIENDPTPNQSFLDNVNRKYDRKQIDPLDFIEDVQPTKLVDKRKCVTRDDSYWNCCCPDGTRPRDFAKSLRQNYEAYVVDLCALQRRSVNFLEWGDPVVVGRHCSDSLDVWRPRQCMIRQEDPEEANTEAKDIIGSSSEDEFDALLKKVDSSKRKFNFKSKCRTYGREPREKPEEPARSVYTFIGSSDEEDPLKTDNRRTKIQDRLREEKIDSGSEDSAQNEAEQYVPGAPPAKKKRKQLRLGLGKTRTRADAREPSMLGKKSFYGKSVGQAFELHHVTSEEPRPRNAAPKESTNLQDILKPSLKVNVSKVGLSKKLLHKYGRAEPISSDRPNEPKDEVEIVDTLAKRAASGDGEVRPKGRGLRKLASLSRSAKAPGDGGAAQVGKISGKRLRLESGADGENEASAEPDVAKRVPSTPGRTPSPDSPFPKVQDVPCPLCGKKFAQSAIEEHASDCQGGQEEPSWISRRCTLKTLTDALWLLVRRPKTPLLKPQVDGVAMSSPAYDLLGTPKNKYRCYICQGVFDPTSYKDHVVMCVARKRTAQADLPLEPATPEVEKDKMENLEKENCHRSLLSHLDTPKIGVASRNKTFNCVLGESPVGIARSLYAESVPFNHIDEGNFSMAHVSTPTFQMFKPISQLKDSLVDFKNQFPVACQRAKKRAAKLVKTKKRKKSFQAKKSSRGRKSK